MRRRRDRILAESVDEAASTIEAGIEDLYNGILRGEKQEGQLQAAAVGEGKMCTNTCPKI